MKQHFHVMFKLFRVKRERLNEPAFLVGMAEEEEIDTVIQQNMYPAEHPGILDSQ